MKRSGILIIALLSLPLIAAAQQGQITLDQDPGIERLLEIYKKNLSEAGYFTIQVGFGNSSFAQELKTEAEVDFPQWRARIVFDSPTYRVQLGRFKTRLEAEREFLTVRKKYPGAILLRPE